MADKVSFKIDCNEVDGYTPNADAGLGGGPGATVKMDGVYNFQLEKATPDRANSGNPTIEIVVRITDEDEKGGKLYGTILCGGKDKNGDYNSKQLWDYLMARGLPLEQVKQMKQYGPIDVEALIGTYLQPGATFAGTVRTEINPKNGQPKSKFNGSVTPENAAKAKAEGKHRWPARLTTSAAAPSGLPSLPGVGGGIPGLPGLPGVTLPGLPAAAPAAAAPVNGALPGLPGLPGFPAMPRA